MFVLQEEEGALTSRPSMLAGEAVEVTMLEIHLTSRFPINPSLQVPLPGHNYREP